MAKTKVELNRSGVRELMKCGRDAGNFAGTGKSNIIRCRERVVCGANESDCKNKWRRRQQ